MLTTSGVGAMATWGAGDHRLKAARFLRHAGVPKQASSLSGRIWRSA
jgi:hypothetical protein